MSSTSPTDSSSRDAFDITYLRTCISILTTTIPIPYILIGGGSMILYSSPRCTNDLDILVPSTKNVSDLVQSLAATDAFTLKDGALTFAPAPYVPDVSDPERKPPTVGLDILLMVVEQAGYEDLIGKHTISIDNTNVMTLPVALGVKLAARYLRPDSSPAGILKEASDRHDIHFLARILLSQDAIIDDDSAKVIKISHYNLLLLRFACSQEEIEALKKVACSKFLKKWEEDTDDQREFYVFEGAQAGCDPLTVELEDLEEDEARQEEEEEEDDDGK